MDIMMAKRIPAISSVSAHGTEGSGVKRRAKRLRSVEEKRRIVEETFAKGVSVSTVARRHDVNANLVFTWRREYEAGKLERGTAVQGFIPVGVVDEGSVLRPALPPPPVPELRTRRQGKIKTAPATAVASIWRVEVELQNGVKVRIGAGVDGRDMRRVLLLARGLS